MKQVKLPNSTGQDWRALVHDLAVIDGQPVVTRPIHVLTLVGSNLALPRRLVSTHAICIGLENKLANVNVTRRLAGMSWRACIVPARDSNVLVHDYDREQVVIMAIEAYLASIYSVLETTAFLNHAFNRTRGLKKKFREQIAVVPAFGASTRPWLDPFYDIRTQLTHLVSTLPRIQYGQFRVTFTDANRLLFFQVGDQEIRFEWILELESELLRMLDDWANTELPRVERAAPVSRFDVRSGTTLSVLGNAGDIIDLLTPQA